MNKKEEVEKIYIDCGLWTGDSVLEFKKHYSDYKIYGFECHPEHKENLLTLSEKNKFIFINKAVWIKNQEIPFFLGTKNRTAASTVHQSKKKKIDKENPIFVEGIDFSEWIIRTFNINQYIVCKMNIEGAEYNVLEKMIKDNSINYINKLFISWHYNKIEKIGLERHKTLLENLKDKTEILPWIFVEGQTNNPFKGIL